VNHFDALAPRYDRLRPAGDGWAELAERELTALAGTTRLIDVGCGTGRFAVLAAERLGARVWGVDRSAEMLREAKRRPEGHGVGWRQADAGKLPFRDGWFDGAHAHLVLHLIDDLTAAVAELARVMAPGGRLVVGTFAPEHFREFFLNPYFPSIPAIDLARFPDPGDLCAGLASAGFANAEVERFDQDVTAAAPDVLERVRGRYISTLRLLDADEYAAGLTRLEAYPFGGLHRIDTPALIAESSDDLLGARLADAPAHEEAQRREIETGGDDAGQRPHGALDRKPVRRVGEVLDGEGDLARGFVARRDEIGVVDRGHGPAPRTTRLSDRKARSVPRPATMITSQEPGAASMDAR